MDLCFQSSLGITSKKKFSVKFSAHQHMFGKEFLLTNSKTHNLSNTFVFRFVKNEGLDATVHLLP